MTATILIILFALVNILDIITTEWGLRCGLYEYNPLIKRIHSLSGVYGFILFKALVIGFYIVGLSFISLEGILLLNIVFILVSIVNLWGIQECLQKPLEN